MNNLFKCLEELNKTDSLKEKEVILKKYDSIELRAYLDIASNPYRVFYVNKLPKKADPNKTVGFSHSVGFDKFLKLVELIETRTITGHKAIHTARAVLDEVDKDGWLEKALTRKPIGVGTHIINRAFDNCIPSFDVMLADNKQPDLNEVKYPVLVQPKLDGFRAIYIPSIGFMGRNGKPIRNKNIQALKLTTSLVLDGELYSHEADFNTIASILNSEDKEVPDHIKFYIFDGMPESDWKKQSCKLTYQDRYNTIKFISHAFIKVVGMKIARTKEIVEAHFKNALDLKFEGLMLKDPNGLYQWKRVTLSSGIMSKLKPSITEDLTITGFVEGEGKFQGMLGKFLVDYNGVEVGVGSGYTDEERQEFWKNRNKMVGKVIEVKGMQITADKSIRHPVFIRVRGDK